MPFPSLYRAQAVSVRSGSVEVFVPQVFGETSVTITDALGTLPTSPGMGWVFFQAGNPEFPVWSSGISAAGGNGNGNGNGGGTVVDSWFVQGSVARTANWNTFTTPGMYSTTYSVGANFPLGAENYEGVLTVAEGSPENVTVQTWVGGGYEYVRSTNPDTGAWFPWRAGGLDAIVIGTGADEVWVGPGTPPDAAAELWYDTDEASDTAVNYWNTAWGVVAKGTFAANPVTVAASVNDLTVGSMSATTVAGRRYQVRMFCNAFGTGGGAVTGNFQIQIDGTTSPSGSWNRVENNYGNLHANWILENLAAGAHSFRLRFDSASGVTASLYNDGGHFLLEDLGPVTRAAVEPPSQVPPTTVASGNALGVIAIGARLTSSFTNITAPGTNVNLTNPVTFTAQIGRRYRLQFRVSAASGGGNATGFAIGVVEGASTLVGDSDQWVFISGTYSGGVLNAYMDGDGLSHTVRGICESVNATAGVIIAVWVQNLIIEDVGPNSSPALPVPATPQAWTPITPVGGWGVPSASEIQPGCRKIGDVVYLKGSIVAGSSPAALGQPVFNVPAGFYNSVITRVSPPAFLPSGNSTHARFDISNSGACILQNLNNATIAGCYIVLNGVSWPVSTT